MKKILVPIIVASTLVACDPRTENTTRDFILPHDLKNCEVITLSRGGSSSDKIHLLRCPDGVPPEYIPATSESHAVGKTRQESSTYFVDYGDSDDR